VRVACRSKVVGRAAALRVSPEYRRQRCSFITRVGGRGVVLAILEGMWECPEIFSCGSIWGGALDIEGDSVSREKCKLASFARPWRCGYRAVGGECVVSVVSTGCFRDRFVNSNTSLVRVVRFFDLVVVGQ
jgi:hypothetical protein